MITAPGQKDAQCNMMLTEFCSNRFVSSEEDNINGCILPVGIHGPSNLTNASTGERQLVLNPFRVCFHLMSHAELLSLHLKNAGAPRAEQNSEIYADDLVVEFPYAPEGHTRRLEGSEAFLAFFSRISSFAEGFSIGEPTILSEGDKFVAEYHGSATFKESGLPYEQDYVLVASVRDGKLAVLREHYDPMRVLRAMGEIP